MVKTKKKMPPGRPVSGYARFASAVNEVLRRPDNIKKLEDGLQSYFDNDPVEFVKAFQELIVAKQPRKKKTDTIVVELTLPKGKEAAQQFEIPLHDVEFQTDRRGVVLGAKRKTAAKVVKGRKVKAK